jgi:hypothetical protein
MLEAVPSDSNESELEKKKHTISVSFNGHLG